MTIESELARIGDLLQKLVDAGSSKSESSTTPKKTRIKAVSESPQEAPQTSSSTSAAPTQEAPRPAVAAAAPAPAPSTEAGTSPASKAPTSVPTLDQVRYALTQCQARNGGAIDKPREILSKYAKTGTLGSLAEADRAAVIAACDAS